MCLSVDCEDAFDADMAWGTAVGANQSTELVSRACMNSGQASRMHAAHVPDSVSALQAFVKARGDGLGFDFGRASFVIAPGHPAKATVSIDGQSQPKYTLSDSHAWKSVLQRHVI